MTLANRGRNQLVEFHGEPPASDEVLERLVQDSGLDLPDDYLAFLHRTNGGEGFIGRNAYVILWGVQDLLRLNQAYQVSEYTPGLLFFGSDGGGEAFAFDMRSSARPVVTVPFVGMDFNSVRQVAPTFEEFLTELSKI